VIVVRRLLGVAPADPGRVDIIHIASNNGKLERANLELGNVEGYSSNALKIDLGINSIRLNETIG